MAMLPNSLGTKLETIPDHVPPELVYDFDYINDPQLVADPHLRMQSLVRDAPGIFFSPWYGGHWVTTRKQVILDVTRETQIFTSRTQGIPAAEKEIKLLPLTLDPPEHTKYRAVLNPSFSPKAVAEFEPVLRQLCNELIDRVIDAGRCDFLADIAEPLPVTLFMTMAGMPTDRLHEFRGYALQATASTHGSERDAAFASIMKIMSELIKQRQARRENDLISRLLDASIDGRPPTFEEMQNYCVLLFIGGLDTVVNAMSWGIRHLARDQALQALLRSADISVLRNTVEELLRLYGVAMTIRQLTQDHRYQDVAFKRGDRILLLLPAVNYDATAFECPAQFKFDRRESHVTFNAGPHRCVGANLARLELLVLYQEWLKRVPVFRLDPEQPATYAGGMNLAIKHLPLVWTSPISG
jgi:cytochrome P450